MTSVQLFSGLLWTAACKLLAFEVPMLQQAHARLTGVGVS